jgi:dTDP-4-amino-4,6-dideoxygalactose transaminase
MDKLPMAVASGPKMRMQVPFFRYPHVFKRDRQAILDALTSAADAGAYIMQSGLRVFEEKLAAYCGVRFAIGVGNATDGMEMFLRAAGIGTGDEVVIASHTMVATASAVVSVGAVPVFAEVAPDHILDPEDVVRRVSSRTRAIMPTQLNGRTGDMDLFRSVAERHRLLLLEDSAQGIGSRFKGRMAGSFGLAGVLSFYPAKVLGCLGDGGAVLTSDEALARELRQTRDHGRDETSGEVVRWGRNSRLDNLQAVVLSLKLEKVDEEIGSRRQLAARYRAALGDVSNVVLPPAPDGAAQPVHFDTFQNYEIEADDRDALRTHLSSRGVGTLIQWGGKGVHEFEALGLEASLPRTERMMRRSLMLPMNTSLTDDEVDYVAECIREFYTNR